MTKQTKNQDQKCQDKMKITFTKDINTREPVRLAGNTGTSQRTARIEKVQMYQHLITVTNLEMSIKDFGS